MRLFWERTADTGWRSPCILGAWAAEAMLGKRDLPQWNAEEDPVSKLK